MPVPQGSTEFHSAPSLKSDKYVVQKPGEAPSLKSDSDAVQQPGEENTDGPRPVLVKARSSWGELLEEAHTDGDCVVVNLQRGKSFGDDIQVKAPTRHLSFKRSFTSGPTIGSGGCEAPAVHHSAPAVVETQTQTRSQSQSPRKLQAARVCVAPPFPELPSGRQSRSSSVNSSPRRHGMLGEISQGTAVFGRTSKISAQSSSRRSSAIARCISPQEAIEFTGFASMSGSQSAESEKEDIPQVCHGREVLPPAAEALVGGGHVKVPAIVEGACLTWLRDWEGRQQRLLQRHEEATRQLVDSLRRELTGSRTEAVRRRSRPLHKSASMNIAAKVHLARAGTRQSADTMFGHGGLERGLTANTLCSSKFGVWSVRSSTPPRMEDMGMGEEPSMGRSSTYRRRIPDRPNNSVRNMVYSCVHSRFFSLLSSVMIALYTVAVGVMANSEIESAVIRQPVPEWLWYVDLFFNASFVVEVSLRVISDGCFYFTGPERNWNAFDVFVATIGVADLVVTELHIGFLRVLRACRALRVLRVLKQFPVLRDLRLMAESICACVPSLAWAVTLVGSVQYIFAVVLLRGASEKVRNGSMTTPSQKVIQQNFASLWDTLFSLTLSISGGRSWGEFADPFVEVSPVYGACFPLFVVFVIFGAVNILTGIFVESTSCIANYDKELAVEEELSKAENAATQIRDFFDELDVDSSGTLSLPELEQGLSDQRVKAYFSVLQIDATDSHSLFHLLDKDGSGEVDIEEFIEKCLKLRGNAKAMDLMAIRRENRTLRQQFKVLMHTIENHVEDVSKALHGDAEGPSCPP